MNAWRVEALLGAAAQPFRGDHTSAIAKQPLDGPVLIHREGLTGDEQADRTVHGGPEKAVHCYPLDHHAAWRDMLGLHPLLEDPGAFGSNLAIRGLSETDVHIGDRFRFGGALIELCQPRQPCWKIEHRFDQKRMVAHILQTGCCGFYFRVLEEGHTQAGDMLERVETGHEEWSVARVFETLFGLGSKPSPDDIAALLKLDCLAEELKASIARKFT